MSNDLHTPADLVPYGINPLTGEACAYSMRILCDLTLTGVGIMRRFLGLPEHSQFEKNWNSTVGGQPAVASVMVPRSVFKDLMVFCLVDYAGYGCIIERPNGSLIGMRVGSALHQRYEELLRTDSCWGWTLRIFGQAGRDRNPHQMTGRTA